MKVPILRKNDNWEQIIKKLKEENNELIEAIDEGDKEHIAEEAWDNIQVSVGVLYKLKKQGVDIKKTNLKHLEKLIGRDWKFEELLEISKL